MKDMKELKITTEEAGGRVAWTWRTDGDNRDSTLVLCIVCDTSNVATRTAIHAAG